MAGIRRGIPQRGRGAPKRSTDWFLGVSETGRSTVAAGSNAIVVAVPSSTLALIAPATVVRTYWTQFIESDQAGASEDMIGAFGAGFVNEVAFALGVTGLPGPATQSAWDGWFIHKFFQQRFVFVSGVGFESNGGKTYDIDSKAMRKFEGDEGLVFMLENSSASFGISVGTAIRMLVKAG